MCWAPRTCLQYAPCVSTQMVQHTNSTGDIKAELVRQGGRLPEWLIVRERVTHLQEIDACQLTIACEWAA